MKLELKHIAPYLPFELKGKCIDGYSIGGGFWVEEGNVVLLDSNNVDVFYKRTKPLLRPLSQLTKEITHNGKTFIPLVRIAEMSFDEETENKWFTVALDSVSSAQGLVFSFDFKEKFFTCADKDFIESMNRETLEMFQKLHEWHFDLYDLIKNNLAIEIK